QIFTLKSQKFASFRGAYPLPSHNGYFAPCTFIGKNSPSPGTLPFCSFWSGPDHNTSFTITTQGNRRCRKSFPYLPIKLVMMIRRDAARSERKQNSVRSGSQDYSAPDLRLLPEPTPQVSAHAPFALGPSNCTGNNSFTRP
ncbi:hypothetical protein PoB_003927900, partial [Plakobranchus ocellatus]